MVSRGPDGGVEVELLDADRDAHWQTTITAERDPTGWWRWLAALAAGILVVGVVGWLLDGGGGEPAAEPDVTPVTLPMDEPVSDGDRSSAELDATPALTPEGVPEGIVGPFGRVDITIEQVDPPGIPDSTSVLGHNGDGAMVAIRWDGRVTQVLQGDSRRYLPQVSNVTSIVGTLTFTGEWLIVDADGVPARAQVDDDDAPLFVPGRGGFYVVHNNRSGSVEYMNSVGEIIGEGPDLLPGTRIVGDSSMGLVVIGLDGGARLIDHADGTVLREIDGLPLSVGYERYLVTACRDGQSCDVLIRSLADDREVVVPVDPRQVDRLVVGFSPSGLAVAYRENRGVTVADTETGETLLLHDGPALGGVTWLGDKYIVIWEPDGTVMMGSIIEPNAGWVELDLAGLIDPNLRGLRLLAGE